MRKSPIIIDAAAALCYNFFMENFLQRTEMLLGTDAVAALKTKHVAVFGLGGVGSFAVEALARAGVGTLTIVDNDVVTTTNINRQLYALCSTVGKNKTEVASARIHDINADAKVFAETCFFDATTAQRFDFAAFDYVIDAIDTVTSKILLVQLCQQYNTPLLSCMSTGNKLDASRFKVADIYKTAVCPLCRVMRKELKKRGIKHLTVLYSDEEPQKAKIEVVHAAGRRQTPASISFVPSVAGLLLAGYVVRELVKE
jgi:tRNA A37 threonylcarbamoyladenosine dehydratase